VLPGYSSSPAVRQIGTALHLLAVQVRLGCSVFAGAVNLPLYRAVETPGFYSNVKRFVMATAFAMTATGTVIVRVAMGLY